MRISLKLPEFRIFDKRTGSYIPEESVIVLCGTVHRKNRNEKHVPLDVKRYAIEFVTGFIDSTGKKIFFLDLLKHKTGVLFQYRWDTGQGKIYIVDPEGFVLSEYTGVNNCNSLYDRDSEIIGRIGYSAGKSNV